MAKKIQFTAIEDQINQLHNGVSKVAKHYHDSEHYTPDGRVEKFAGVMDDQRYNYRGRADKLRSVIGQIQPSLQERAATARAQALPNPTDPTERLAAEMEAQRIMARDGMNALKLTGMMQSTGVTPGMAVAAAEYIAQGKLDPGTLDAVLETHSPELAQANKDLRMAPTFINQLETRLDNATKQMSNTAPVDTRRQVPLAEIIGDHVSAAEIDVPAGAFEPVPVDPVFRNN